MKTLDKLKPKETGTVTQISSRGALKRRIVDMGITPGVEVEVIKTAPLGDPLEIKVRGYNLSIRKSEAMEISVRLGLGANVCPKIYEKRNPKSIDITKKSTNTPFKVALIGNPNSGKTTLFNQLTGSYQYVGNWPGVTVARKEGRLKKSQAEVDIVDLPGIYSFSAHSPEEIITRNYVLNGFSDLILNIVDATNLERNLYLTTQLLEMNCKVVVALNMVDLLKKKGKEINFKGLSKNLGVPVVPISSTKNKGIDLLLEEILNGVKNENFSRKIYNTYSADIENALENMEKIINENKFTQHARFKMVKLLEGDSLVISELGLNRVFFEKIEEIQSKISKTAGDREIMLADERYNFICRICAENVKETKFLKNNFSHRLDRILTGKYTALPVFLLMIFSVFYVTFGPIGSALQDLFKKIINDKMTVYISNFLTYLNAPDALKSLVLGAVITGAGAVISFLPQIVLLFTLLSLLEDCGYMARAVFIMDKTFKKIGLSGKAFVPLIMGFGCSVPAITGTRILENKRDRNLAIFLIPFMSCSAKAPIYMFFASIFFPGYETLAVFSLYIFGALMGVFTALLFKDTLFKGGNVPFVMEMPEYKLPSLKNLWLHVWERIKDFIERAGTVILGASIIIWFLNSFTINLKMTPDSSKSILAAIGGFLAPVFKICGFGNWQATVALLTGVMAKESIVSTFAVLYGGVGNLAESLAQSFTPISAVSFLIFVLLYTPCVAAISAMFKEFSNKKLSFYAVIYQLFTAFLFSALAFQGLSLLNFFLKR